MNTKRKYVWKLYSGANWYLGEVAEKLPFVCGFIAVGALLTWIANVG